DPGREAGALGGVGQDRAHPRGDRHVVGGGVYERLGRQGLALLVGEAAVLGRLEGTRVVGTVGDDRDARVVLRRRTHHGRAADVDLLDAVIDAGAGGDRGRERVEVHHDEVERLDAELLDLGDVLRQAAVGQDPGVHPRVERLHAAVEALGEAGEVLDLRDRQAERVDQRRGTAGGHELDARLVEAAYELLEPGLVENRDQRAADLDLVSTQGNSSYVTCRDERHCVEGTQADDAGSYAPWWSPTFASRVPSS